MKKKCNWCEETIAKSREDFHEIGWSAVQFGNKKTINACPKHEDKLIEYSRNQMITKELKK